MSLLRSSRAVGPAGGLAVGGVPGGLTLRLGLGRVTLDVGLGLCLGKLLLDLLSSRTP
jgi:hypothetical protein